MDESLETQQSDTTYYHTTTLPFHWVSMQSNFELRDAPLTWAGSEELGLGELAVQALL